MVRAAGGKVFANSRDVAEFFTRRHAHVLGAIRVMMVQSPINEPNFQPVEWTGAKGEQRPSFDMDRTGFVVLAMGFTGARAMHWKHLHSEAFDQMEAQLRAASVAVAFDPATLDLRNADHLLALSGGTRSRTPHGAAPCCPSAS